MKKTFRLFNLLLLVFTSTAMGVSQTKTIHIDLKKPKTAISPTMYGIFFEDINFGADGGLYAELIKNRSFEFYNHLLGWLPVGGVEIKSTNPCFDRNPNYVQLTFDDQLTGTGLENEGFKGMGVKEGENYLFSFYSRNNRKTALKIKVELIGSNNDIIASKTIEVSGEKWTKYSTNLVSKKSDKQARLRMMLTQTGCADFDHISLFPEKTYKNRPCGLREDLAKALEELKPGLFRFPGGCIVEGTTLATRYQWKNTIGAVENRPVNINRWNYTFDHRRFPDYYQSYGLGFFEYFQLSEDIGAEPLPVLNCGLSCQFENKDDKQHCPADALQPYIDDALDLIEFANGDTTTKWGKMRAELGHPKPFNLKYLAVGNEQWGEPYALRIGSFVKAIRAKYPKIRFVGSSGPYPDGKDFEFGWNEMRRLKADLVDEHYYRSPDWFLKNATRYDNYDRKGPKVFAGEYACHVKTKKNSFEAALCEAAFMTGLERNADIVEMTAYAPLFAHVENWQWRPDLIWFDNLNCVRTPSYYVQQMYASHVGTHALNTLCNGAPLTGQDSLYASSATDKKRGQLILRIANTAKSKQAVRYEIEGLKFGNYKARIIELSQAAPDAENTIDNPNAVVPKEQLIDIDNKNLSFDLKPQSFLTIIIETGKK